MTLVLIRGTLDPVYKLQPDIETELQRLAQEIIADERRQEKRRWWRVSRKAA